MSYGSAPGDREGGSAAPAVLIGLIVVMIGIAVFGVSIHQSKRSANVGLPSVTTVPAVTTTAPTSTVAPPSATTVAPGGSTSTTAPTASQLPGTGATATTTTTVAGAANGRLPGAGPGSLSRTGGSPTEVPALALLAAGLLALAIVSRASMAPEQSR